MERIFSDLSQLIGRTPLLEASRYGRASGLRARLLLKIEAFNPCGSAKDRPALFLLDDAERRGVLRPGGVVIEPTSGNTGVSLAALAAARGYRVILTMPETMSVERRMLLSAYGAELVLTPGAEGMSGAIAKANELAAKLPGSFIPGQFENPANPAAHYETTGPEIWSDTEGRLDVFVACVGTGGTLSGAGRYLKEQNPALRLVAVEPAKSPVLSGGAAGRHGIQGIGAGFVPKNADTALFDEIVRVRDEEAFAAAKALARTEGLLAGISSGAALHAAAALARQPDYAGKTIVALLPDTGERYLSTGLWED